MATVKCSCIMISNTTDFKNRHWKNYLYSFSFIFKGYSTSYQLFMVELQN